MALRSNSQSVYFPHSLFLITDALLKAISYSNKLFFVLNITTFTAISNQGFGLPGRHPSAVYSRTVAMNIFILDHDIKTCAQYHCDQHVGKMVLESVQILCTALNKKGISTPYRSTHSKHPCVLWAEASFDNFCWLKELTTELNREYRWRYNKPKDHASIAVLAQIDHQRFESAGLLPFAQAMPEQYKESDQPVTAYRNFYCGEKARFATWKRRQAPHWWAP